MSVGSEGEKRLATFFSRAVLRNATIVLAAIGLVCATDSVFSEFGNNLSSSKLDGWSTAQETPYHGVYTSRKTGDDGNIHIKIIYAPNKGGGSLICNKYAGDLVFSYAVLTFPGNMDRDKIDTAVAIVSEGMPSFKPHMRDMVGHEKSEWPKLAQRNDILSIMYQKLLYPVHSETGMMLTLSQGNPASFDLKFHAEHLRFPGGALLECNQVRVADGSFQGLPGKMAGFFQLGP